MLQTRLRCGRKTQKSTALRRCARRGYAFVCLCVFGRLGSASPSASIGIPFPFRSENCCISPSAPEPFHVHSDYIVYRIRAAASSQTGPPFLPAAGKDYWRRKAGATTYNRNLTTTPGRRLRYGLTSCMPGFANHLRKILDTTLVLVFIRLYFRRILLLK